MDAARGRCRYSNSDPSHQCAEAAKSVGVGVQADLPSVNTCSRGRHDTGV